MPRGLSSGRGSESVSRSFRWCSAGMEQSATRDSCLLLTFDIRKGDQVSLFSSVIQLTWCCPLWWSADVCVELCNSFRCRFCKVPPQLCDGSIILTFVAVVVAAAAAAYSSSCTIQKNQLEINMHHLRRAMQYRQAPWAIFTKLRAGEVFQVRSLMPNLTVVALKCGFTAPKIAKNCNFWYKFSPKGHIL